MTNEDRPSAEALADRIESLVRAATRELVALAEHRFDARARPSAWSARQLLGHLVDSASNNHQRFVRAGEVDHLEFPG